MPLNWLFDWKNGSIADEKFSIDRFFGSRVFYQPNFHLKLIVKVIDDGVHENLLGTEFWIDKKQKRIPIFHRFKQVDCSWSCLLEIPYLSCQTEKQCLIKGFNTRSQLLFARYWCELFFGGGNDEMDKKALGNPNKPGF